MPADPTDRDEMWEQIARAALKTQPPPIAFRLSPAAAQALVDGGGPCGQPLVPLPPEYLNKQIQDTLFGIALRTDERMPPDMIAVEHPDGRREYVKVMPPRRFATYSTAPAGSSAWRRFLHRCRSLRRARRS